MTREARILQQIVKDQTIFFNTRRERDAWHGKQQRKYYVPRSKGLK
jgi:hypothetical protein